MKLTRRLDFRLIFSLIRLVFKNSGLANVSFVAPNGTLRFFWMKTSRLDQFLVTCANRAVVTVRAIEEEEEEFIFHKQHR